MAKKAPKPKEATDPRIAVLHSLMDTLPAEAQIAFWKLIATAPYPGLLTAAQEKTATRTVTKALEKRPWEKLEK